MYSCSMGMLSLLINVCISLHKSPFQHKKEYCSDKVLSNTFGRTQVVERKGKRMFSLKRRINGHWKYHVQKKYKSLSENSAYLLCIVSFKSVLIRKETCIPEAQVICDFLLPGLIWILFCRYKNTWGLEYNKTKRASATPAQRGGKTCQKVLSQSPVRQGTKLCFLSKSKCIATLPWPATWKNAFLYSFNLALLRKQTKCGCPEGIQVCQKTAKCTKDQYCPLQPLDCSAPATCFFLSTIRGH